MPELNEEVRPTSSSPPLLAHFFMFHLPRTVWTHSLGCGITVLDWFVLGGHAVAVCQVVPEF